jgi:acetylornithine deacetylase/succinyl-diaminopimelate desuccinylase-like protein
LIAGYTGEGAKTVLPSKAVAKLDFRLVPDMDPEKQFERLTEYLKENGFDSNNTLSSITMQLH